MGLGIGGSELLQSSSFALPCWDIWIFFSCIAYVRRL